MIMRNIYKYWQIVAAVLLCMTSCALDEDSIVPETPEASFKGDIHVVGAVVDFDNKYVGTKALGSEENDESLITEMTMFIFDANGDIVAQPVTIRNYNTTPDAFLIEIGNTNTAFIGTLNGDKYYYDKKDALAECEIYVVANSEHYKKTVNGNKVSVYSGIERKDQLLDQLLPVSGFEMPRFNNKKVGFPMIGTAEGNTKFNLLDAGMNQNTVATIPLRKLYSKVTVNIMVNAAQVYNVPKFDLDEWSLVNIPKFVSFRALNPIDFDDPDDKARMEELYGDSTIKDWFESSGGTNNATNQSIEHTASVDSPDPSSLISFTFYMPEYLLTPQGSFSYPAGIKENEMQRFKPALLDSDQKAAHVQIKGSYTDHHAVVKQVVYRLYLGQNNYDNFNVLRNQHLVNHVTIKGVTNSTSANGLGSQDNISIDHRVDVINEGFSIAMERETLVDAHFEFRPVDIMLSSGSSLEVTVPESCSSWIAIEMSQPSGSSEYYVPGKGVRKYFTTNLISELTTPDVPNDPAGPVLTLVNETDESQKYRIWVYIDENHDVCDKTGKTSGEFGSYSVSKNESRSGMIQFVYSDGADGTQNFNYNIEQKNLWRIWNGDSTRYYDIEYYEEYLYNYAADDPYGNTTNGMPWGLNGVQLSNQYSSFHIEENNEDWNNYLNEGNYPKYDFYIEKHDGFANDNGGKVRSYAGQEFTSEIYTKSQGKSSSVEVLTMAQQADGAVEYCYNRNKRKSDGSGSIAKMVWYLPSADEMEDIIIAGYSSFKEFQENFYWTSQPAYIRNIFYYEYQQNRNGEKTIYTFDVYDDNPEYARATKVVSLGNDSFDYEKSGLNETPDPPYVDYTGEGEFNRGFFNVMYRFKRYYGGFLNLQLMKEIDTYESNPNNFDGGQEYNDSRDGKRYHVHLGHLYDLTQKGYRPRDESNRIRCVYRSGNVDQND